MAETSGTVSLYEGGMASPNATPKYTFDVDANGDYKGDVAPGSYTLAYRQPNTPKDKVVDQIDNIKVVVGQDTELFRRRGADAEGCDGKAGRAAAVG